MIVSPGKGSFTTRTFTLRYLIIIVISVQHAQKGGCDRNPLRPAMRRERDSLARVRNSSRWQRGGVLGPLGDNPTCIQGLKVVFVSFQNMTLSEPKHHFSFFNSLISLHKYRIDIQSSRNE